MYIHDAPLKGVYFSFTISWTNSLLESNTIETPGPGWTELPTKYKFFTVSDLKWGLK